MLNEIAEKYPQDEVSVHVVWLPMVPGDNEQAARSTGKMYAGHQVHQYYDGERVVGLAYRREVFPNCLRDALSVVPKDNPFHAELSEWASTSCGEGPLWDAVLFYPPGVEWGERAPTPTYWSKQFAFRGIAAPGESSASFFRDDCKSPPVESDWYLELRRGLRAMESSGPTTQGNSLRIELLGFPGCPNTPKIRKNLEVALASLSVETKIADVNLETLPEKDPRRGWGAPTILVNRHDLMGLSRPASRTLSCRMYSNGLPSADEIAWRLRLANEKTQGR